MKGKKVFVLGNPVEDKIIEDKEHYIAAYSYVSGEKRMELINRAKTNNFPRRIYHNNGPCRA